MREPTGQTTYEGVTLRQHATLFTNLPAPQAAPDEAVSGGPHPLA
jgi:hypothetical protein